MASLYWVGGTDNWDATAGTKWATVDGGAGGAAVPTSSDDVFFTAASGANTVTVSVSANCLSLDFTGFTGTFVTTSGVSIAGNMTLSTGMTFTPTASLTFTSTTTGKTITSNGKNPGSLLFSGIGGGWTLQDDLTCGSVNHTTGTLNTNGKTVSMSGYASAGSGVRVLTLGASAITLNSNAGWSITGTTNLTVNANTSNITVNASRATFAGAGFTYNNVTVTGFTTLLGVLSGSNTYANLTVTAPTATTTANGVTVTGTHTVTGTFTANGSASNTRFLLTGGGTINAAAVSLIDVDFNGITAGGAASPFTGTRLGKRRTTTGGADGNSNITFTAGVNRFWVGGTGNWTDSTNHWANSSGGAAGTNNFPLPQDNVVFDAASNTTAYTVTMNLAAFVNDISFSAAPSVSGTVTFAGSTALDVAGSVTMLSGMSATFTGTTTFNATTSGKTLTFNGKSLIGNNQAFDGVGGVWTVQDTFDFGINIPGLKNGTLDINGKTTTGGGLAHTSTGTFTLTLGAASVTLTRSNGINWSASGMTLNANTSTITLSAASPTFTTTGLTFNNVSFTSSSSTQIPIAGANTFNNLTLSSFGAQTTNSLILSNDQTVTGTFTVTGNSANNRPIIQSDTAGTVRTITAAVVSLADVDFQDITGAGAASPFTGTRLGDCKNNSGITFPGGVTKYYVGNTNSWTSSNVWATTSGGAGATNNFPLPQDTAFFDANSFSATGQTVTFTSGARAGTITFNSGIRGATTFSFSGGTIFGDVTLSSAVSFAMSGSSGMTFSGRVTQTVTTNGVSWTALPTIDSIGGTVVLADNLTLPAGVSSVFTLTNGTLNLNGKTLTIGGLSSNNSNVRSITPNGGNITIASNAATLVNMATATNFTLPANDPLSIFCTYSGATGTRTITFGSTAGATTTNAPDIIVNHGTDNVTFTSGSTTGAINFTGFSGAWTGSTSMIITGSLTISTGMTVSTSNAKTFGATSGTQVITSNGKAFVFGVNVTAPGATVQLADDLTISGASFTLTSGTLDLGTHTLGIGNSFNSSNTNTRSITASTGGNITLPNNSLGLWSTSTTTGLSVTAPVAVNLTYSGATGSRTITSGAVSLPNLTFNISSGSDSITITTCCPGNIDFTGFNGTLSNGAISYGGDFKAVSGMTFGAGSSTATFIGTNTTNKITSAGKTFDFPISFNTSTTYQLQDNLTLQSTRAVTLTAGTLDLNTKTLVAGSFSSSNSSNRTITPGVGGVMTFSGNAATVWDTSNQTNMAISGAMNINFNYSGSTGTRTINGAATDLTNATFKITAGTDIVAVNSCGGNLDFTGFAGTMNNTASTLMGNLTVSTGMTLTAGVNNLTFGSTSGTKTVTTNGKTFDFPVIFNSVGGTTQLSDNLTVGSSRTTALTAGTLDLNTKTLSTGIFNTTGGTTRALTGSGAAITITSNAATVWEATTLTNFTQTGSPVVTLNYIGATGTRTISHGFIAGSEAKAINFSISAGSDTILLTGNLKDVDFTGFTGTYSNTNIHSIFGNLILASGMTVGAGSNAVTFAATSGTKTITSNGQTMDFPVTLDGVGGTWKPADTMTLGTTRALTLTNGTFDVDGKTVLVGSFSSSNSNTRTLKSTSASGKIATTSTSAATVFDCTTGTGLTVTRNSWTIEIRGNTTNTRTLAGGGKTWPTVTFTNTTANGELDIVDSNTFKSLLVPNAPQSLKFTNGTTTTIEDDGGFSSGTVGNLLTLDTVSGTGTFTLTKTGNTGHYEMTSNYLSVTRGTATPSRTWVALKSTNGGTNTGWVFSFAKAGFAAFFLN
jgi:hypothetical protein